MMQIIDIFATIFEFSCNKGFIRSSNVMGSEYVKYRREKLRRAMESSHQTSRPPSFSDSSSIQQPSPAFFNDILSKIPDEFVMSYAARSLNTNRIHGITPKVTPKDSSIPQRLSENECSSVPESMACCGNEDKDDVLLLAPNTENSRVPEDDTIGDHEALTPSPVEAEIESIEDLSTEQLLREFCLQRKISPKKKTIFSVVQEQPIASKPAPKKSDKGKDKAEKRIEKHTLELDEIQIQTQTLDNDESDTDGAKYEMDEKTSCENQTESEISVQKNTLIFNQFSSPDSAVFTAKIRLENTKSYFLGYKVFCNRTAATFFSVSSKVGVVPPVGLVDLIVATKKSEQKISNAMIVDAKFVIKMFQTCSSEMRNLLQDYNELCRNQPGEIYTHSIDRLVLCSEKDFYGTKIALDSVVNPRERSLLKDELYNRYCNSKSALESDEDDDLNEECEKKTTGRLQIKAALLYSNQQMRNYSKELLSAIRLCENTKFMLYFIAFIIGSYYLYPYSNA